MILLFKGYVLVAMYVCVCWLACEGTLSGFVFSNNGCHWVPKFQ